MGKRGSLFTETAPTKPEPAAPEPQPAETRKHPVAKTRQGKRNVTAYLDPAAFTQLRLIAVQEDTTVQDLLVEGVNHVFAARGKSRIA